MKAKEKYGLFRKIIDHNMKAMTSLSKIREVVPVNSIENKGKKVVELYMDSLNNIRTMAEVYCQMKEKRKESVSDKIEDVEQLTKGVITNLEMLLKFSYEDTELMELALKELAEKVETISKEIQDPNNPKFSLSNIITVHDLIRYFHQEAIEEIFNLNKNGLEEEGISIEYPFFNTNTMTIELIDLGGGIEKNIKKANIENIKCEPLKEILKGIPAETNPPIKNMHSKNVWAFIAEDYIDLNISMGTYIANISALLNDLGGNYIMFRFKEWCDEGRKQARMKYLGQIFKNLGLKTKTSPLSIEARVDGISKEKGKETLKNIGRLIVTTDNLDWALVDPEQRENKKVLRACIERFMQGKHDITDYGMSLNKSPYKRE